MLLGVTTKLAPVPTSVPPQLPVYQSTTDPAATDAESVEDWPDVIDAGFASGLVGALGVALTVTVTAVPQVKLPQSVVVLRERG